MKKLITIILMSIATVGFNQTDSLSQSTDSTKCLAIKPVLTGMAVAFVTFYHFASDGFEPIKNLLFTKQEEE